MRLSTAALIVVILGAMAGMVGFIYHRRMMHERARWERESLVRDALGELSEAEQRYREEDLDKNGVQDYWTGDIADLHRLELISGSIADADAAPLRGLAKAPIPYSGYYFIVLDSLEPSGELYRQDTDGKSGKVHHRSRFAFCAYPARYAETGRETYIITQDGPYVSLDVGGKPLLRFPDDILRDPFPLPK